MEYYHVDVFSKKPFAGNGLTVILSDREPDKEFMQKTAQELKQFETIFLIRKEENVFRAIIFTVEEELDFAGHPILGAAAVLHERYFTNETSADIQLVLNQKMVQITSEKEAGSYRCCMNQGKAEFLGLLDTSRYNEYLEPLNLSMENLEEQYPLEVISTGLPYLVVPVKSGLEKAKILVEDYENQLQTIGAKFVYIFDINRLEGRTWDNLGKVEDVATGSAAGPVGAYLYKRKLYSPTESILLQQGRFLGRPSVIEISMQPESEAVLITGYVKILIRGELQESDCM